MISKETEGTQHPSPTHSSPPLVVPNFKIPIPQYTIKQSYPAYKHKTKQDSSTQILKSSPFSVFAWVIMPKGAKKRKAAKKKTQVQAIEPPSRSTGSFLGAYFTLCNWLLGVLRCFGVLGWGKMKFLCFVH